MGLMLAEPGFHARCFVEWDEYPRRSLIAAQVAGCFAPAPIWDDVTSFDARPFAGAFDTLLAGYPCQPFSHAGQRRGENDERHLWPDIARIIGELGPDLRWIFLENVAGHVTLGLEAVLRALRDLGFTPAAGLFSAGETGAPHERLRIFIVAYRAGSRCEPSGSGASGECDSGQSLPWTGSRELADAHGRNASAERQQRGGQQRLHPEGGCDPVAMGHASGVGRGEGRPEPELRRGRDAATGAGGDVGDPDCDTDPRGMDGRGTGNQTGGSEGCNEGQGQAPIREWLRSEPRGASDHLADASEPGSQGREWRGASDERVRPPAHGPVAELRRPCLFPPGPSDADAWALVLHGSPHLAPALGRQGIVRASFARAAQLLAADAEAAAQSGPGGMAGSDALQALGGSARSVLDPREIEPFIRRMADGLAARPRALRLLGNGVFPLAAGYAWRTLAAAHGLRPLDMGACEEAAGGRTVELVERMTHDQ